MTVYGAREGHQTRLNIGIIVPSSSDIDPGSRASKGMSQIQLHSSVLEASNLHPTPVT